MKLALLLVLLQPERAGSACSWSWRGKRAELEPGPRRRTGHRWVLMVLVV